MSSSNTEIVELFNVLESNKSEEVKEIKAKFAEMFVANSNTTWLVNGLIEYYYSTGSLRAVDILSKVPVPHDKYLFDKISDGLKSNWRCDALELLGHIVRRQPMWLHTITNHKIFNDLLKVIKNEKEIVPLMSAVLVLITLLPMIPTLICPFFNEIFDVFGRLAACESYKETDQLDGFKEHLQVALYGLFHNLYGMYPCNFMDYLKREYTKKENKQIFMHTIKPMLETIKVHPLLITASKNAEIDNNRLKKMEHPDVLMECRRFSTEGAHKQRVPEMEENSFRTRCGTDVSSLVGTISTQIHQSKSSNSTPNLTESQTSTRNTITMVPPPGSVIALKCENLEPGSESWFSLVEACGVGGPSAPQTPLPYPYQENPISYTPISQPLSSKLDSGSPPETAIEATPENTPIKDTRQRFNFPSNSPAVRALNNRLTQPLQQLYSQSTLSYSQPPSPLKKEPSPFGRMMSVEGGTCIENQDNRKDVFYAHNKLSRVMQDRSQQTPDNSSIPSPQTHSSASPLKKLSLKESGNFPSVPNSPVPLGATAPVSGSTDWPIAKPQPHKDGMPFDITAGKENITNLLPNSMEMMKDDKEIIELSKRGEVMRSTSIVRDAHLVFESEFKHHGGSRRRQEFDRDEEGDEIWPDDDTACEGDFKHCPDAKHGLHMPNSNPMLSFAHKATRSRYYSHCVVESISTVTKNGAEQNGFTHLSSNLRKSASCPNLYTKNHPDTQKTVYTQTVDVWPLPYEHLFNNVIQKISEQTFKSEDDRKLSTPYSPYSQVDEYIDKVSKNTGQLNVKKNPKDEIDHLRQQLQILQIELLYERHRREVHAFRNRRLLGRSRKDRAAEEQNSAMKQLNKDLQYEIEELKQQLSRQDSNIQKVELKTQESCKHWQHQVSARDVELTSERNEKEKLMAQLVEQKNVTNETSVDVQHLHSLLFEVSQQLTRANQKTEMCDKLMDYIKKVQRELVMYAEKEARYGCLGLMPTKTDALVAKITQQYKDQIINAQSIVQSQTSKVEFLQAKEAELETCIQNKDYVIQELKKQLCLVKEEYNEKLKATEEKYNGIKKINQRLEAHCLELLHKIPQSPQTISRDLTSGFSPQSSPLSASLASSEGHGQLLGSRVDEIRNLQVIVNTHEESSNSAPPVQEDH